MSKAAYSRGFMHTRNNNPNRQALERGISALEGGETAAAFAAVDTAAAMALFQALAPGDHVLAHVDAYYGTSRLLREIFLRWGLEADFIDMSNLDEVQKALRKKTRLAWIETPSNPLLKIVDHCSGRRRSFTTPVRSAFATIHGLRCYSAHSISAQI